MKLFDDICKDLGLCREDRCPITSERIWYAYKDGAVYPFSSEIEARKLSNLIEKKCVNQDKIDAWWESRAQLENMAFAQWYKQLEEEYVNNDVSPELFRMCYEQSYSDGHSAGYDEVACLIDDVIDFALRARACK